MSINQMRKRRTSQIFYKYSMNANLKKGQKVITPDGEGIVEEIIAEKVTVKLSNSQLKTYDSDQLEDDSDAG
jgi:preprotein translocase subunit YajC